MCDLLCDIIPGFDQIILGLPILNREAQYYLIKARYHTATHLNSSFMGGVLYRVDKNRYTVTLRSMGTWVL